MSPATLSAVPLWVNLCGKFAPATAVLVFLAPFPTIQQVKLEKSVGGLPLLPYSTMISSSFLWMVYGVLKKEPKIWSNSGFGFVMGIYYVSQFVRYAPTKSASLPGSVRQHMHACVAIMISTALVATSPSLQSPEVAIGLAGVVFAVAMFASPLAALKVTLETKSAKNIPLPFTIASVLNCFLWTVSGLLDMRDVNIYLPNMLGLCFGLTQGTLKLIYGDGVKEHGSEHDSAPVLEVVI